MTAPAKGGHTPVPWTTEGFDVEAGLTTICTTYPWAHGIEPYGVDNNEIAQANAAFIVTACNAHATLLARCERLEAALTKLLAEFDDMDEHRPLHVGCIQCTEGATPDRYNTGPCAYHAARAELETK